MANFNNEDRRKIHQLENELKEVKKELDQLKAGGGAVGNDQHLGSINHPTGSMDIQQRVNRRRRRNLPAELKVEIVDCFPVENAVHFLANVPNRLIIHHCAPRIRRILKMILQISADYARTLPAPDSCQYTPEIDIFLRYGAAHCRAFSISGGIGNNGFIGYPENFFDDLIKHYYETKIPAKAILYLSIGLPRANPAPWPATLVQPQAGEMNVKEMEVGKDEEWVRYILYSKHNPRIAFRLNIYVGGNAKRYQQMTHFVMWRV